MLRSVRSSMTLALASLAGIAVSASAQVGPFTGSEVLDLSAISFPAGTRTDFPTSVTDAGQVLGYSTVERADNGQVVFFSWSVVPGSPAVELTLTGPQYLQPDGSTYSFASDTNSNGLACGATTLAGNIAIAADAWVFNGQELSRIGLSLTEVGQTPEVAYEIGNYPQEIADSGDVVGTSYVLRNDGAHFYVGWYSREGQTVSMTPPGPEFIDPTRNAPYSFVADINANGVAVGGAVNFANDFAYQGYKYFDGQFTFLGLRGPKYEDPVQGIQFSSAPAAISDNGVIVGSSIAIPGQGGTGAWIDIGAGAVEVGLTGPDFITPENNASSFVLGVSSQGVAYGTSKKFLSEAASASGFDTASFAVIGTETIRIGLLDSRFVTADGREFNYPFLQTRDGTILGTAPRLDVFGITLGTGAWVFDPARRQLGTVEVGLSGPDYVDPNGSSTSFATAADDGIVAGISLFNGGDPFEFQRYDGFVANLDTGATTRLRFSQDSQGRALTYPVLVTQRGGVFGYYSKYENDQYAGDRPFYWSPRAGFVDLLPPNGTPLNIATLPQLAVSPDGTRVAIAGTLLTGDPTLLRVTLPEGGPRCDSVDFNNDGSTFDPTDIDAFLSVFSEGPCIPEAATCNDVDFNNDGSLFDPQDIDAFLSVFSEGPCI